MKYGLNDVMIVPAAQSLITSRTQCDPYDKDFMLPLFTAPMSSVVSLENYKLFEGNKIHSIIPRNIDFKKRLELSTKTWVSFSLEEFIALINACKFENGSKIVIDIANGHMITLHNAIKEAKSIYGDNIKIMAGNIANPETYKILSESGADYVRLGIGGGSMCLTSSNTGVHYSMYSLIRECFEISCTLDKPAYIVADGGIRGYADVIKCLASGADYVMCGYIFNKMLESAGKTQTVKGCFASDIRTVNQYDYETLLDFKSQPDFFIKESYGMSTKKAQIEMGATKTKTSEGVSRKTIVEYTMEGWIENFIDYLKSAMSYTSSYTLDDFIGNVEMIVVSNSSYQSINK